MAKEKSKYQVIADWIKEENITDKKIINKRIADCISMPSYETFQIQHINQKTNYTLIKVKDNRGIRDAFSLNPEEICIISKTTDVEKVNKLLRRQESSIDSRTKTRKKLSMHQAELYGQLKLDFGKNDIT